MIRDATSADIPQLLELMLEAHARSKYAGRGVIDETYARQLFHNLVMYHGGKGTSGTHCMVVECEGRVVGLHFAMKQRIEEIGAMYFASDVKFYVAPGAPAFAAAALFQSFLNWAALDKRVIEIRLGVNDVLGDKAQRDALVRVYEKHGFTETTKVLTLAISRPVEQPKGIAA